jgi:hypothetical protein
MSARQSLPPLIRILLIKKKRKKKPNKIGENFNMVLDETGCGVEPKTIHLVFVNSPLS